MKSTRGTPVGPKETIPAWPEKDVDFGVIFTIFHPRKMMRKMWISWQFPHGLEEVRPGCGQFAELFEVHPATLA